MPDTNAPGPMPPANRPYTSTQDLRAHFSEMTAKVPVVAARPYAPGSRYRFA